MQVHRLWWIPDGHAADDGVYVRYPADELLAVAAIVAERTGTLMVGEDLGTVPHEVSELLADWGLVGMYEEVFTLHAALGTTAHSGDGTDGGLGADGTGHRTVVPPVREATWAGIRTHDMPALARTVTEVDTSGYRTAVGRELGREIADDVANIATAMIDRMRIGGVHAVVIDLDDALGDTVAHNEPGTVGRHNWTHRTARPVDELADEPLLRALLDDRTIHGSDHPVGAATTRGGQP
jgi:4-alpha-glucanotransferase